MASSISGLSASVTRILSLTGFPKELKTKDIQSAFTEWESLNGGFKIKWRDDTSLLIVFQDATVAKRAYLHTIAFPPQVLTSLDGLSAVIRPYDGPDAQAVIQNVNSRGQHNTNPSRSHNARSNSISGFSNRGGASNGTNHRNGQNGSQHITIPEHNPSIGREPSPTLPSLPSQPTLNSLINSSLSDVAGLGTAPPDALATGLPSEGQGPRIGDPGKRMLGAALGVRHPGLAPRMVNGGSGNPSPAQGAMDSTIRDMQRAMGGLIVAE